MLNLIEQGTIYGKTTPNVKRIHIINKRSYNARMKILAINTALKTTEIAIINGKKIMAEKSWESQSNEAEKLLPAIDALLKKAKIKYDDLNAIFALKGPGSFTGLRVGIAAANAMAFTQKIKLFEMGTIEYLWELFNPKQNSVLVLFAGRAEVYMKFSKQGEITLKPIEEAVEELKKKKIKIIFGQILPDQQEKFKDFKIQKQTSSFGKVAIALIPRLKPVKIIEPLYIKGPNISKPKNQ